MNVRLTPRAEADIEGIADYIAQDSPQRALDFLAEFNAHGRELAATPVAFPACPEFGEGMRSSARGGYVIFFQPEAAGVKIVRVLRD